MTALIIDTSTERLLIAVSKQKNILTSVAVLHHNRLSQILFPTLARLLSECQLTLDKIDYLCSGIGPGSYTGTRVGATIGKTLAYALNIPLLAFCSLQAFLPKEMGKFAVCFKTKKGEVSFIDGLQAQNTLSCSNSPRLLDEEKGLSSLETDHIAFINPDIPFNPGPLATLLYERFFLRDSLEKEPFELIY